MSSASPLPAIPSAQTSPSRNNTLECDYDVNPTYLYQAIEARQWKHAKDFLETNDQAHAQAATWVIRKETNGKLRWRLLPLHAAIIFGSPLEILELLLAEYPAAAQSKDDQGMLPLHLAFRNFQSWDILEELLTAYPHAISVKDRKGRTPLQCASSSFRKPASVLELYTHVAVTTERVTLNKKNQNALQAQIGALQESHIRTLEGLKGDWQERSLALEQELKDFETHYTELQALYGEAQEELSRKAELEHELTEKLRLVTEALTMNENSGLQAENLQLRGIIQDMITKQVDMQQVLNQYVERQDALIQQRQEHLEALVESMKCETERFLLSEVQRGWQESNQDSAELLSKLLESSRLREESGSGVVPVGEQEMMAVTSPTERTQMTEPIVATGPAGESSGALSDQRQPAFPSRSSMSSSTKDSDDTPLSFPAVSHAKPISERDEKK